MGDVTTYGDLITTLGASDVQQALNLAASGSRDEAVTLLSESADDAGLSVASGLGSEAGGEALLPVLEALVV